MPRDYFVYTAKVAEQADHFAEMVDTMNSVARMGTELTLEERNLLSLDHKSVIGAKHIRILASIEPLDRICCDVIDTTDITFSSGAESSIYYRMYLAESTLSTEKIEISDQLMQAYEVASRIAQTNLSPTNPIRLGLALNISVFHYEIMNSPDRACELAKKAFDEAVSELDLLNKESNKDNTLLMELLRDNIVLWSSDMANDAVVIERGEKGREGRVKGTPLLDMSYVFPTPPPPKEVLRPSPPSYKGNIHFFGEDERVFFPYSTPPSEDFQAAKETQDFDLLDPEIRIASEKLASLVEKESPKKTISKKGRELKYLKGELHKR